LFLDPHDCNFIVFVYLTTIFKQRKTKKNSACKDEIDKKINNYYKKKQQLLSDKSSNQRKKYKRCKKNSKILEMLSNRMEEDKSRRRVPNHK